MFHSCNLRKLRKLHNFDYLTDSSPLGTKAIGMYAVSTAEALPRSRQNNFTPGENNGRFDLPFGEWTSISSEVDFSRRLADLCIHSVHRTG